MPEHPIIGRSVVRRMEKEEKNMPVSKMVSWQPLHGGIFSKREGRNIM